MEKIVGKHGVYLIDGDSVDILGDSKQVKGKIPVSQKLIETLRVLIEKNRKELDERKR